MSIYAEVGAFSERAVEANSSEVLKRSFKQVLNRVGADKFFCAYVGTDSEEGMIQRSISNIPWNWQQHYLDRGYEAADPIFQCVSRAGAYGFWSELMRTREMDLKAKEVMGHAGAIGMLDGFTNRVDLPNGRIALMMVAGKNLSKSRETRAGLRWASHVFAAEGARMLGASWRVPITVEIPKLSKMQNRVLQMRASGLTNKEVAGTIGTVSKTVECHVTQILRRLKARNMIDAIRIAKSHDLIQ